LGYTACALSGARSPSHDRPAQPQRRNIMSRIFISGSTNGLGLMAGELLTSQGHGVVLHARNTDRAEDARRALPKAEAVVVGDVETIAGAKDIASQVNARSLRCRDP
jgi:NAD(P)-dependent dehydrogenase (short-subunit alcohol dehydrogenase family)